MTIMKRSIFLLALIIASTTWAQKYRNFNVFKKSEIETNNERIALVIANSDYDYGKLDKPVEEAQQMVEALAAQGYDVEVGYNLDQAGMKQTIINFSRKFGQYKSGIVYFAGHGFQIDGENYLVPTDTPQTDVLFELKSSLINLNYVFEAINDPDKPKLVVLDACRNNPFKANLPSAYRSGDIPGFAKVKARDNSEVLFSTAPGTKVSDENPFTRILSEEIMAGGCFDDVARRANKRIQELDPNQMITKEGFLEDKLCFGPLEEKNKPEPKVEPVVEEEKDKPSPQNDQVALEEALSWMQGKMDGIKFSRYYDEGMLARDYRRSYNYSMEYDLETCKVTITENEVYVQMRNSTKNDYDHDAVYEFDLSDIGSIEYEESYDRNYFVIKTYNSQDAIKKTNWWDNVSQLKELRIQHNALGDLEGAPERFIKAFEDARQMCGAKSEKY